MGPHQTDHLTSYPKLVLLPHPEYAFSERARLVELAREKGCILMQLTTSKKRTDAQRFYRRLGFVNSHEGMKLAL